MQNSRVTVEVKSSASAISEDNTAADCAASSCIVNEGGKKEEEEERENNLDDVVFEDINETNNSNKIVENLEIISLTTEAKDQTSHDDFNSICKDLEKVNADETDNQKLSDMKDDDRSLWSPPDASYRLKYYQNQPMKIENYEPGMSSVVLQDPFINNCYNPPIEKPGENCKYTENDPDVKYQIRKANGAASSSLLENSVRDLYRKIQKGGEIPLEGLRCPIAPVKAHRFCMGQRNTKSIMQTPLNLSSQKGSDLIITSGVKSLRTDRPHSASAASTCAYVLDRRTRDELSAARKQELEIVLAEARRKRLMEEAESNRARRHSDNFHPHVKSPVALNRYDLDDMQFRSGSLPTSPLPLERPLVKARALYTFKAQTNRELSLNKGDTVYILRLIDKNWYEGQWHGTVGIFPVSYVEVLENSKNRRNLLVAKFDFLAENSAEMSFQKGDVLRLQQVVDSNWYDATIGNRSGLVPKAYVEPLHDHLTAPLTFPVETSSAEFLQYDSPGTMSSTSSCPSSELEPPLLTSSRNIEGSEWNAIRPTSSSNPLSAEADLHALNGSFKQQSMLVKQFQGNSPVATDSMSHDHGSSQYGGMMQSDFHICHHPVTSEDDLDFQRMKFIENPSAISPDAYCYAPENRFGARRHIASDDILPYIVCHALYSYVPQDEDELELSPGDVIYVTETFDDGWYVGISQRTNACGTFPGNYVQRLRLCHNPEFSAV